MISKIISYTIITITIVISLTILFNGPETIILHWDFNGNITRYGTKYAIILLPVISVILYMILLHYLNNPFEIFKNEKVLRNEINKKHIELFINTATPIILLMILYVTLCSGQLLMLRSSVLIACVIVIITMFIVLRMKLIRDKA